jgi:hypothetical protein
VKAEVTVDGRAFLKELSVAMLEFQDEAWQEAAASAHRIRDRAKQHVRRGAHHDPSQPVLAETIEVKVSGTKQDREIIVGTEDYVGLFLEFGTLHNAAFPFMRPAIAEEGF